MKLFMEETEINKATFAAGCFWGVEEAFRKIPGVVGTRAGYTGGHTRDPSYEEVCAGGTGHAEAVEVRYNHARISYEKLLEVFWTIHDPTTKDKQGPDVGAQYRSVIFYHSLAQKAAAERSKEEKERSGIFSDAIVTEILPVSDFYEAEEYHQQYLGKKRGETV